MTPPTAFVFDLDDTLYKERDYVASCFEWIGARLRASHGAEHAPEKLQSLFDAGADDAIGTVCAEYGVNDAEKAELITQMRAHPPAIALSEDAAHLLAWIRERNYSFSIVTNGRSVTQRRKVEALGLSDALSVAISEEIGAAKPDPTCFSLAISAHGADRYFYVGDNPKHDFVGPNELGWATVMLKDNGRNIHDQMLKFPTNHQAAVTIDDLRELIALSSAEC